MHVILYLLIVAGRIEHNSPTFQLKVLSFLTRGPIEILIIIYDSAMSLYLLE